MWYIWKNRNDKIYSNKNENPQEILRIAKVESIFWAETQLSVQENYGHIHPEISEQSMGHNKICFIDGAWKEYDIFTGHGWYCRTTSSTDVMMGR